MIRIVCIAVAAAFVAAPDLAVAQSGKKGGGSGPSMNSWLESVQAGQMGGKSTKALKSRGNKKGSGGGVKTYNLQNAWPKKVN